MKNTRKTGYSTLAALTLIFVGTTLGLTSGCDDDGESDNTMDAAASGDGSATGGTNGTGNALDGGTSLDSGAGGAGGAGTGGAAATGGSPGTGGAGGAGGMGGTSAACTPGVQDITVKYEVKDGTDGLTINKKSYEGAYGGTAAFTAGNKSFQLQLQSGVTTQPCSAIKAIVIADAAPTTGKVYEGPASTVVLSFQESSNCSTDLTKLMSWNCTGGKVTITKFEGKTLEAKIEGNCTQPLPASVVSGAAVGTFKLDASMKTPCFVSN